MTEHILLIGMMGAGKSSVGRLLARRLGWDFLDSDEQVQRRTGRTIPEIFAHDGEAAFRAEERLALSEAVSTTQPAVVAVAGGAVLDAVNQQVINDAGFVVWLRAPVEELARRVGDGRGRPLLGSDPTAALTRLEAERRPLYARLAHLTVDVGDLTPEDVVGRVLEACS